MLRLLSAPAAANAAEAAPALAASVTPPRLSAEVDVVYPEGAHGDHVVRLILVVTRDGSVQSATPEASDEPFSGIAAEAAQGFRFEPATRAGVPVPAKIRFEVTFREPPPAPPVPTFAADPRRAPSATPPAPPARSPWLGVEPTPRAAEANQLEAASTSQEVVVRGERPDASRTLTLSRAEVRQLPGAFGDPFRAIEGQPGVTPIVSGLPFFFLRGAPPGNVGYFLDGVRLPLLFHIGIGPSVVHPGLIDRVELYPGGYPARFGRFSGGIISGETVAPASALHGEYNLRVFDAGGLVETPFANGRGTVLLGGRYSYSGLLLSLLSPDISMRYWDYQARVGYDLDAHQRLSVFAFGSYDYLGQKTQSSRLTLFGTEFHRIDLRHDVRLSSSGTLRTAVTFGVDRSRVQQDRFARSRSAHARTELNQPLSQTLRLRAGTDLELNRYDLELGPQDLSPATSSLLDMFPARTDLALGVRGDLVWTPSSRFELTPGARVDLFGSQGRVAAGADGRLSTRVALSPRLHLLGALGTAHQPASFVVPLPGFQPAAAGKLQYAMQESFGIEALLGQGTIATATVFQNAFFNMSDPLGVLEPPPAGCPPSSFAGDSLAGDRGQQPANAGACGPRFPAGTLGPDVSGGSAEAADTKTATRARDAFQVRTMGSAYGLELYLKRRLTSRMGGFLSYTLSRSTRSYGNRKYVASFDRTHVVSAAVAYDWGRGFRTGLRVLFYTGLPQVGGDGEPASSRLPSFFRTDLRFEKRWQLRGAHWLSLVAEWMNATLSKEAVSTRCTLQGCEFREIGPVTIPSLGLEGGF